VITIFPVLAPVGTRDLRDRVHGEGGRHHAAEGYLRGLGRADAGNRDTADLAIIFFRPQKFKTQYWSIEASGVSSCHLLHSEMGKCNPLVRNSKTLDRSIQWPGIIIFSRPAMRQ